MSDNIHSYIEDLSNELWLEIFKYLDWINLFQGFYNLNKRINQILVCIQKLSLYSSYLIRHDDRLYIFFQEFPLDQFKYIQHFRLIFDTPYEDAQAITNLLPSFPNLVSLNINDNSMNSRYMLINDLGKSYICKYYPYLQELPLHTNSLTTDTLHTFDYPLLRRIEVHHLHLKMALQTLDQCPNLCVLSTEILLDPADQNMSTFSIAIPHRISMGLPALKKLYLNMDATFKVEPIPTFISQLVRCCPNLHTFCFEFQCIGCNNELVDPIWWSRVLVFNKKLKRISLQMGLYGTRSTLPPDIILKFQILPFFAPLNVSITYTVKRYEFPHMEHVYLIKN